MNRINRKMEYALMALQYMAHKNSGDLTTAKQVSETFHSPFDATARVMQVMAQKGILHSEQGVLGGYSIAKDLSQITLFELMEIIQGPLSITACMQDERECDIQDQCNIISPMHFLNQKLNQFYMSINLKDLLLSKAATTLTSEATYG